MARFGKKSEGESDSTEASDDGAEMARGKPKYGKPNILAIDLPKDDFAVVKEAGFNVLPGTFGQRVSVEPSTNSRYAPPTARLPLVGEQEIVIVDLASPAPVDEADDPYAEMKMPLKGTVICQSLAHGVFDPRVRAAYLWRDEFNRIHNEGNGIFIVFAERAIKPPYKYGESAGGMFYERGDWDVGSWDFLSALTDLVLTDDFGVEITVEHQLSPITEAILQSGTTFHCTIDPWRVSKRWATLAHNKYAKPVAGVLVPEPDSSQGPLFVLPQVPNKGELIKKMLLNYLPRVVPKLFPEDERRAWLQTDQYALPGVADLRHEIRDVEAEAKTKVDGIKERIAAQKGEYEFLNKLLTEQDKPLVLAVKDALEFIGFENVKNVDEEEGEKAERLREDLQLVEESPIVLVEVKGVGGLGKESEQLQVTKYIHPRMKEWERFDVLGLSVINHQMGLPPLERNNDGVFHVDVITAAAGQDTGLLTTFDLYRLVRSYQRNGWQHEQIRNLFLAASGRIVPIPEHYEQVGEITKFFAEAEAAIIQLDDGKKVAVGDRLAYELPIEFAEEVVTSIRLNDASVEDATSELIGIKTSLSKDEAKKGIAVYRATSTGAADG